MREGEGGGFSLRLLRVCLSRWVCDGEGGGLGTGIVLRIFLTFCDESLSEQELGMEKRLQWSQSESHQHTYDLGDVWTMYSCISLRLLKKKKKKEKHF